MSEGLAVFTGSSDMLHPERTGDLLLSCAATAGLVLVQSVDGRMQPARRVASMVSALRERDIAPVLYSFPRPGAPTEGARKHLAVCKRESGCDRVMWDVEPYLGSDWAQKQIDELLDAERDADITIYHRPQWSKIDWRARRVWLQVYQTVESASKLASVMARYPHAVPCTRSYECSPHEMIDFCNTAAPFARKAGTHAVWSAASITHEKAAQLRAWALAMWPAK